MAHVAHLTKYKESPKCEQSQANKKTATFISTPCFEWKASQFATFDQLHIRTVTVSNSFGGVLYHFNLPCPANNAYITAHFRNGLCAVQCG